MLTALGVPFDDDREVEAAVGAMLLAEGLANIRYIAKAFSKD